MLLVDRMLDVVPERIGHGHQERDDERALLPGPLPGPSGGARGDDRRKHGADFGRPWCSQTLGEHAEGKVVYFMFIDNAKFRRPADPGDQMRIRVAKVRQRGNVWKFTAVVEVDGHVAAEASYAAMIINPARQEASARVTSPRISSIISLERPYGFVAESGKSSRIGTAWGSP